MKKLSIEDIHEGMSAAITAIISERDIDAFAQLTGDFSPLHMDHEFAIKRSFAGRVVHGALLNGYISRLCGVHLPGQNCLVQSIKSNFLVPVIAGDEIEFELKVKLISEGTSVVIAITTATNTKTEQKVMSGQVQFGFTKEEARHGRI